MATAGYQVLWAVIQENDPKFFSSLRRDLFSNRVEGNIPSEVSLYDFIISHRNEYRKLPEVEALGFNGFPYESPTEPLAYYYTRLINRNTRNRTIEYNRKVTQILKDNKGYNQIPIITKSLLDSINEVSTSNKYKTLVEIGESYLVDLEQAAVGNVKKVIPFGWPTLDEVSGGGMFGGDVVYAVARPRIREIFIGWGSILQRILSRVQAFSIFYGDVRQGICG